jgi:hypothetical protein
MKRRTTVYVVFYFAMGALFGAVEYASNGPAVVSGVGLKSDIRLDRCVLLTGNTNCAPSEVCVVGTRISIRHETNIVAVAFGEEGKLFASRVITDMCVNVRKFDEHARMDVGVYDDGERDWVISTNCPGVVHVSWRMKEGAPRSQANVLCRSLSNCGDEEFPPEFDGLPFVRSKGGIMSLPRIDGVEMKAPPAGMSISELRRRMREEDARQEEIARRPRAKIALYYSGENDYRFDCRIVSPKGETLFRGVMVGCVDFVKEELVDTRQECSDESSTIEMMAKFIRIGNGDVSTVGLRVLLKYGEYRYGDDFLLR